MLPPRASGGGSSLPPDSRWYKLFDTSSGHLEKSEIEEVRSEASLALEKIPESGGGGK
jgi:hypothetical protein